MKQNLTIIPVINKIDLPHANIPQAKTQMEDILAIPAETFDLLQEREGVASASRKFLEAIGASDSSPQTRRVRRPFRALGFDSLL